MVLRLKGPAGQGLNEVCLFLETVIFLRDDAADAVVDDDDDDDDDDVDDDDDDDADADDADADDDILSNL